MIHNNLVRKDKPNPTSGLEKKHGKNTKRAHTYIPVLFLDKEIYMIKKKRSYHQKIRVYNTCIFFQLDSVQRKYFLLILLIYDLLKAEFMLPFSHFVGIFLSPFLFSRNFQLNPI